MARIPDEFTVDPEAAIASFSFTDIAEGTGIQIFFGTSSKELDGTIKFHLITDSSARSYKPSTQFTTIGTTTHNFDTLVFNLPRTVRGTAYASIPMGNGNTNNMHVAITLQKLDADNNVTEISPLLSGQRYLGVSANDSQMAFIPMPVTETIIKKGEFLRMFDLDITDHTRLTDTVRLILHKDKQYNYRTIYLDDGGMGVGVFDPLYEHEQTKRKVVGINNASRSIERKTGRMYKDRRKALLKEDLYNNLKHLMENKKIELFNSPELRQSLRSIQYEVTDEGNLRIYGTYAHIAEAIIRAAWSVKDKSLNIYYF